MQTELTPKQVKKLAKVKNFAQMAAIAVKSIRKARKKYKGVSTIELCAPISSGGKGSVKANLAEMNKAIEALKDLPYLLFNQLPYEKKIGALKASAHKKRKNKIAYDMAVLLDFYEVFFNKGIIDILIFMPNWYSSIGACWEYRKAKKNGMKTLQLKDNWAELITNGEKDIKKLTFKI